MMQYSYKTKKDMDIVIIIQIMSLHIVVCLKKSLMINKIKVDIVKFFECKISFIH